LNDGGHICVIDLQPLKQISAIAAFKKGYIMRKCCVEPDGRKSEKPINQSINKFLG